MTVELPPGWAAVTLGEVWQEVRDRDNPESLGDAPYLGLEHVESQSSALSGHGNASEMKSTLARFRSGDVLYGRLRPYLNKVARPAFAGGASTEFLVFREAPALANPFLAHILRSSEVVAHAHANSSGVNLPRVSAEKLGSFRLGLPPRAEQSRIVAKIEALFSELDAGLEALESAQKMLERYRASVLKAAVEGRLTKRCRSANPPEETGEELLQRILVERRKRWAAEQLAKYETKGRKPPKHWEDRYEEPDGPDIAELPELPPGWCWATLPQLGELGRGKSKYRPRGDPSLYGGKYPFLQTAEVRAANGWIREFEKTYNEKGLAQSRLWPKGTLCITIAANIAETGILSFPACFPDSVVGFVSPGDPTLTRFIEFFIRNVQTRLERYAPATAQKNINLTTLSRLAIPVPPDRERAEIVDRVDGLLLEADLVESTANRSMAKGSALRSQILRRAFVGRLVPQDPDDEPASVLLERIRAGRNGKGTRCARTEATSNTTSQAWNSDAQRKPADRK